MRGSGVIMGALMAGIYIMVGLRGLIWVGGRTGSGMEISLI